MKKNYISTGECGAQHPLAGQNLQQHLTKSRHKMSKLKTSQIM